MSDDQMVTVEVDGRQLKAKAGTLLIEVTDAAGINIPRFCYHKKLSVSANCRMCLVEVAKVPKPLPACATPVNEGMQVFTRSPLALAAQKGTMEFLLINHPLDCPICDQGGECELQDVALGYGNDSSRFVEGKRVVPERDIGPLIATDFTRCIHCTRCVRFGAEIAGVRELGATGRGEHMEIGTYIEKSVDSELSGNIIDVCPVGSLTSKPYLYSARAWELVQREAVAAHDSVGSNLNLHVRRNRVMRVHPRDNEAVNECWISDRDRFSYEGLYSGERLLRPLLKKGNEWQEVEWQDALEAVAQGLKRARGTSGNRLGALLSGNSTLEELYLAQKLMRGLGSENIDYRLRQSDFRSTSATAPWLGQPIAALEALGAALLIGSNIRKDQPMLAHRVRKAALEGAEVTFLNPFEVDLNYRARHLVAAPSAMLGELAAVAKALGIKGKLVNGVEVSDAHKAVAESLKSAERSTVLLGNMATAHPDFSLLRSLASDIAEASGSILGFLPESANSDGAALSGALPGDGGSNAGEMLGNVHKGYLLLGVEPTKDSWNPAKAQATLQQAEFVVALNAFRDQGLEQVADVILPIAGYAETSGTFVNAQGDWQSFGGAVAPAGEARPAWKILRVLGNLLDLSGFDQVSSEEVLAELKATLGERKPDNGGVASGEEEIRLNGNGLVRVGDVPIYAADPLVRRAESLQRTKDAMAAGIYINAETAKTLGLAPGDFATALQEEGRSKLPVFIDATIPAGCARIPAALAGTETLGGQIDNLTLEKA